MERATRALLYPNLRLAQLVIDDREKIASAAAAAERYALCLLSSARPESRDSRAVVTSIQNLAEIERMGALALHVAQIARMRHPRPALPEDVNGYFTEMGRLATGLAESARYVISTGDPGRVVSIRSDDDAMDELHRHLFALMSDRRWKHSMAATIDITLLGRYYDRFADHAVSMSRRVIFHVAGQADSAGRANVGEQVWNRANSRRVC